VDEQVLLSAKEDLNSLQVELTQKVQDRVQELVGDIEQLATTNEMPKLVNTLKGLKKAMKNRHYKQNTNTKNAIKTFQQVKGKLIKEMRECRNMDYETCSAFLEMLQSLEEITKLQ